MCKSMRLTFRLGIILFLKRGHFIFTINEISQIQNVALDRQFNSFENVKIKKGEKLSEMASKSKPLKHELHRVCKQFLVMYMLRIVRKSFTSTTKYGA